MKSLANCTPKEFLVQTNKIRKSVAKWLELTDLLNLREEAPKWKPLPDGSSPEEIDKHLKDFRKKVSENSRRNLDRMLEAVMEKHPDETVELLALLCFVEPRDANKHSITEYLKVLNDLLGNETVIDFFTSLVRLAQTGISKR